MRTLKRWLMGLVLALGLSVSPQALAIDSAPDNWRWPAVLANLNSRASALDASCKLWVEAYGSAGIRAWKRCGVGATPSGVQVVDYTFSARFTNSWVGHTLACPDACLRISHAGDGSLATLGSAAVPTGPTTVFSSNSGSLSATGVLALGGGGNGSHSDYQLTCTGAVYSPDTASIKVPLYSGIWFSSLEAGYVRDTRASYNAISGTCGGADTLVYDYGTVASDCSNSWLITGVTGGRPISSGSCDCIPFRNAIIGVTAGPVCAYTPITGDPGGVGVGDIPVGTTTSGPGHTYTNSDLAQNGGAIPTTGGTDGGFATGTGGTGANGNVTPGPGTAGSGTGLGGSGGAGGGGSGSGSGNCPPGEQNCNGDGTVDAGGVPGSPSYNSSIADQPTEDSPSWIEQIQSFVSSSPAISAITGSGITASGSCTLAASVMGASVDLGFCNIPSSFFTVMSAALLIMAHLVAFFIIFR